jgi:tripartite-type tricarboxylate transporter receptor subunit TctC
VNTRNQRKKFMNYLSRRSTVAAGLVSAFCLGLGSLPVQAQDYPVRPIKLIVPFGAGTTTDIISRVIAEGLSKPLGQPVVVENRSGAGGVIGTDLVAKGAADGYTILMGTVGTHAINATLFKKLPYDPLNDFAPLAFAGYTPTLLVVAANSPLKTVKDLAAQARKQGSKVSFASAGNGTSGHLAGELLKARIGGDMVHVPYKQGGLALTDVMGGQVQFMFYHPAAVLPHIKSGKLRALGASSAKRSATAPDVPTLMEQGVTDFDLVAWFMMYAPVDTPAPVLARLRDAAMQTMASPQVAEKLGAQGLELRNMNPDELASFGRSEIPKWAELVKRSGAQVD